MSWWLWVLLAWLAASVPIGVVVGRMIRLGRRRDLERQRHAAHLPAPGPQLPAPRTDRGDRPQ